MRPRLSRSLSGLLASVVGLAFATAARAQTPARAQTVPPVPIVPENVVPRVQPLRDTSRERVFETERIAFTIPDDWRAASRASLNGAGSNGAGSGGSLANLVAPGAPGATLNISRTPGSAPARLPDNLAAQWQSVMKSRYPEFRLLGSARLSLSGADAIRVDGALPAPGRETILRNRQVYVVQNGRMFLFTLTAVADDFARLSPGFDRLLQSIRWLPATRRATGNND